MGHSDCRLVRKCQLLASFHHLWRHWIPRRRSRYKHACRLDRYLHAHHYWCCANELGLCIPASDFHHDDCQGHLDHDHEATRPDWCSECCWYFGGRWRHAWCCRCWCCCTAGIISPMAAFARTCLGSHSSRHDIISTPFLNTAMRILNAPPSALNIAKFQR